MIQLILTDPTGSPLGHMVSTHAFSVLDFVRDRMPECAVSELIALWDGDGPVQRGTIINQTDRTIVALFAVREILDTQPFGTAQGAGVSL